jgi:hypothetical protein
VSRKRGLGEETVECVELALFPRESRADVYRMHARQAGLGSGEDRAVEAGGQENSRWRIHESVRPKA